MSWAEPQALRNCNLQAWLPVAGLAYCAAAQLMRIAYVAAGCSICLGPGCEDGVPDIEQHAPRQRQGYLRYPLAALQTTTWLSYCRALC